MHLQDRAAAIPKRLYNLFSALRELGPRQLSCFAIYRLGLSSGYFRRATRSPHEETDGDSGAQLARLFLPPDQAILKSILGEQGQQQLLAAAEEVVAGKVRLFSGDSVLLQLQPPGVLRHWTEYELTNEIDSDTGQHVPTDIKYIWEPARMGWAILLGRAYILGGDERYPVAFWGRLEEFLAANPPYLGLNWISAQEVALRLITLVFCWQIFALSPHSTPERASKLKSAIAQHAMRIPPTLVYARAQNNNHLLSEAAGLYTAGLALPDHPQATYWRSLGWFWFQRGLLMQIAPSGAYIQHSINYHRLMLGLALWMDRLIHLDGLTFSTQIRHLLGQSTRWLLGLLDSADGGVPNLGPNDGADILPFSVLPFSDYRPVLKAAASTFLQEQIFDHGPWDEMGLWLANPALHSAEEGRLVAPPFSRTPPDQAPHTLHSPTGDSWAYLRVARFNSRPGHADQLHVDLWWRGLNVACDAGTYLYNAPPPWDNRLAGADVHNTLTVDGLDQMQRSGRFLYLKWAQARLVHIEYNQQGQPQRLLAQHDGYNRLGLIHQRSVTALPRAENPTGDHWLIEDELLPTRSTANAVHRACLHWLLPDWPWKISHSQGEDLDPLGAEIPALLILTLTSPLGAVELRLSSRCQPKHLPSENPMDGAAGLQIIRGGELVFGTGPFQPTWGWISPTYGKKIPGLSVRLACTGVSRYYFRSEWRLGDQPTG